MGARRDWRHFQIWGTAGAPFPDMYIVDPSGDSVQLNGATWQVGTEPEWAMYATDDALCGGGTQHCVGGLCSQGNCTAASSQSNPRCRKAVAALCPGLQSSPFSSSLAMCTDCIYDASKFAALVSEHGCRNADLWQYCISDAKDTSCHCHNASRLSQAYPFLQMV